MSPSFLSVPPPSSLCHRVTISSIGMVLIGDRSRAEHDQRWRQIRHEQLRDMSLGQYCPSSDHVLLDGIAMVLSWWHGLQLAVENQWGGIDSIQKSHQLIVHIFTWFFSRSRESLYVEELENLLHESMLLSFNTEIEDGSIEEVAEQLMSLHEEYMQAPHY